MSSQRMIRAAWSLAARASTSSPALYSDGLTSYSRMYTSLTSLAAINFLNHHSAAAPSSLPRFSKSFHSGSWQQADDAATEQQPVSGVSPLQQAPAPATSSDGAPSPQAFSSAAGPGRAHAIARNLSISPRKLNMFVQLISGMRLDDALIQCAMHPKKSATMCEKVLLSAKANAVNNHGLGEERLLIDQAWVGKGTYLKRTALHGRGRSGKMMKYRSHLTIVLKEGDAPRRTKVVPMVQERQKWWNMREGIGRDETGTGTSLATSHWWPRKAVPPGAMRGRKGREAHGAVEVA